MPAGDLASSGQQQLATAGRDCFTRGSRDDFELSLRHLGNLQNLRIWHNGTSPLADWHLALVIVIDNASGQRYVFVATSCRDTSIDYITLHTHALGREQHALKV